MVKIGSFWGQNDVIRLKFWESSQEKYTLNMEKYFQSGLLTHLYSKTVIIGVNLVKIGHFVEYGKIWVI